MKVLEMTVEIVGLIDDTLSAVLATVDDTGKPHMRWMTPGCLRERPGALFMLSASDFTKVEHLRNNAEAELMLQSRALDKIITVRGKINVLENPSIRTEVIECIGHRLHAFWKAKNGESELVVLELIMDEATRYLPMKGRKDTVSFT